MAILVAFIYGFSRRSSLTIGNFWVLLVRGIWILLPKISFVIALVLVSQGTPQTFGGPVTVLLLPRRERLEWQSRYYAVDFSCLAASQIAIKMLGTNGGGFRHANRRIPMKTRRGCRILSR